MGSAEFIVFDCDGVLVDSEIVSVEIETALLNEAGFTVSEDEVIERFVGLSYASMVTELVKQFGRPLPDGLQERIQSDILAAFPERLQPVDGIVDFLATSPLPRCLASSSNLDRIALSLDITGLTPHFAAGSVFSAQMVQNGKPAPDLFLHAAATMDVNPTSCVVIEDSAHGVKAGVAAGMRVIGFTGGKHANASLRGRLLEAGASVVVGHPSELDDLLQ